MSVHSTLQEKVSELAKARQSAAAAAQTVRERELEFREQNAEAIESAKVLATEVASLEATVKALTLDAFTQTGEKKPAPGVEVKEIESVRYAEADAIAWAKVASPNLVTETLDTKAFEKIAKVMPLDFVQKSVTPRAQIASSLPMEVAA